MNDVIQKLLNGNKHFRELFFAKEGSVFRELLQHGQNPEIMVLACSDSRVDPAVIFNCEPGELFVIRNVANLVPPYESDDSYHGTNAALEFGVCVLSVKHVIILGHTQCGGIQALLDQRLKGSNTQHLVHKWIELARPAYNKVMIEYEQASFAEKIILCERYALINSLHTMYTFPWVHDRVNNNTLMLHAWYFDLATGKVHQYDEHKNSWNSSD